LAGADGGDGEGADGRDGDGEDCGVCVGCKTNKRMMKRERERMIESGENESSGARRDQRLIEPA
jgi:hypothetical protein